MLQLSVQELTQRQLQIFLDEHKFNYDITFYAKEWTVYLS